MGSNHRPPPCQGGALPLSYAPTEEVGNAGAGTIPEVHSSGKPPCPVRETHPPAAASKPLSARATGARAVARRVIRCTAASPAAPAHPRSAMRRPARARACAAARADRAAAPPARTRDCAPRRYISASSSLDLARDVGGGLELDRSRPARPCRRVRARALRRAAPAPDARALHDVGTGLTMLRGVMPWLAVVLELLDAPPIGLRHGALHASP